MDIWVVSSFLLLWTMLLWIFMYGFYVDMFPFLLGICLRGKMVGHVIIPSSLFCISKLCPEPKFSVTSTVFLQCPLRRELFPCFVWLPQYCAYILSWSSVIPMWLLTSYCEFSDSKDRYSFLYTPTERIHCPA